MSAAPDREQRLLEACADATRARLRADARALERRVDHELEELGVARHPVAALGVAAAAGALLGKLGGPHVGPALRHGGRAATSAARWSSLLI